MNIQEMFIVDRYAMPHRVFAVHRSSSGAMPGPNVGDHAIFVFLHLLE